MWEIGHRLDRALEEQMAHFIEQQREDYRDGEADEELIEADDYRVAKDFQEFGQGQQRFEMLKAHPGAAQKSPDWREVLETHHQPPHRDIAKYHKEENRGEQQKVKLAVLPGPSQLLPKVAALAAAPQMARSGTFI